MLKPSPCKCGALDRVQCVEVLSMDYNGFSIQKYVGVTPAQLTKLHKVLISDLRIKHKWREGVGYTWDVYAEIKTVSWNAEHGSLTVEVIVYDFARELSGTTEDNKKHRGYNKHAPTERWVITKILNALGRFKTQPK